MTLPAIAWRDGWFGAADESTEVPNHFADIDNPWQTRGIKNVEFRETVLCFMIAILLEPYEDEPTGSVPQATTG